MTARRGRWWPKGSFEKDERDWLAGPPVFEFREDILPLVEETAEAVARLPD